MKVVKQGVELNICSDDLVVYDKIPAGFYKITEHASLLGTSITLEKIDDFKNDGKIYGNHKRRSEKVIERFVAGKKNLGVILSGKKGIGKTLTARLIAIKMVEMGYPVIICSEYVRNVVEFLNHITQEVVVLFDEFEKIYKNHANDDDKPDRQESFLTLFDGLTTSKKLFIITCNSLYGINDFLINRPGRLHFHFRFDDPGEEEIKEFLKDKVKDISDDVLEKVVKFSKRIALNYDCLSAIATELQAGCSFEESMKDLNIVNEDTRELYNLELTLSDGRKLVAKKVSLDPFDPGEDNEKWITLREKSNNWSKMEIYFDLNDVVWNSTSFEFQINGDCLQVENYLIQDKDGNEIKGLTPTLLRFKRIGSKQDIHYNFD